MYVPVGSLYPVTLIAMLFPQTQGSSVDKNNIHFTWVGHFVFLWARFNFVIGLGSQASEVRNAVLPLPSVTPDHLRGQWLSHWQVGRSSELSLVVVGAIGQGFSPTCHLAGVAGFPGIEWESGRRWEAFQLYTGFARTADRMPGWPCGQLKRWKKAFGIKSDLGNKRISRTQKLDLRVCLASAVWHAGMRGIQKEIKETNSGVAGQQRRAGTLPPKPVKSSDNWKWAKKGYSPIANSDLPPK